MDAIVPASCSADESDVSGRTEAEETVILVTTSRNRLSLEGQRVAHQGHRRKTPSLLESLNHLMRLGSLFSYKDMIAAANK